MTLQITPPPNFKNASELSWNIDTSDPRNSEFNAADVEVDIRHCNFVRPPGALWIVTYLVLAAKRGASCRLLVPGDTRVCGFLKSLGLFDILKQHGVNVDDRGIHGQRGPKTVLPITPFSTTAEATALTNDAFTALQSSNIGPVNLTGIVTELFSELVLNAAQHSESAVGSFACVQFFEFRKGPRLTCTVADGGIGVLAHLRRNKAIQPRVYYDWDALELAIRERVSGTGDPHRGIGLYGVSEEMRVSGRSLLLHSGQGALEITTSLEVAAQRTRLFPGTLAYLSIPV